MQQMKVPLQLTYAGWERIASDVLPVAACSQVLSGWNEGRALQRIFGELQLACCFSNSFFF